jgi:lipopolysaccharide transport system permease protein
MSASAGARARPAYVCRPEPPGPLAALGLVWAHRALLATFVRRDVRVRYKHTLLGAGWNVLQPVGMMLVFTLVFGVLFAPRTGDLSYPLFVYPGLLLWQMFSRGLSQAGTSLESFQGVLNKIYFPRLIAPASLVLSALFDFSVASAALVVLMLWYGTWPGLNLLWAPAFVLLALMLSLGLASWLAALDARFKDVRHTLPFATQFWMFATPVMYPLHLIPERFQTLYALNPMVGIVEGFRWSVVGGTAPPGALMLLASVGGALLVLLTGTRFFLSREGTLVDTV